MQLTDSKVIEFFSATSIKSFAAMLDVFRYLDGIWIPEDTEYELFNEGLGDNETETVRIRVPNLPGITANALHAFTRHAEILHLIRRRARDIRGPMDDPEEIVVFYEVTPSGKYITKLLEAIVKTKAST